MAQLTTRKLSELFEDFLKTYQDKSKTYKYRERISELIASGGKSVVIDYDDLIHFNADLCDQLLQDPDRSLQEFRKAAYETMSAENAPYADKVRRYIHVRVRGITDRVPLRKVDTSYLDKMIAFSGMVVRTSELRPLLQDAAFVCPNEHVTMLAQDGTLIKRPIKCESCSESRSLELDQKRSKFIDSQNMRVQELPEELPPGQLPRFFEVDLEGDIVNTARPGDRVILTGVVRAEPDLTPGQGRTRVFRSKIESNFIEILGKEPGQIQITKEDEILIRNIAKSQGAYQKLVNSVAPAIMGHEAVKEAILLLLCGSAQTTLPDGTKLRGDINVLLVGDPGVAKSEMLKFAAQVAPRGIFASGRGSTAAGLSAAVIREKNVLMLEAGVVVLADQGIACLHPDSKVILDGKVVRVGELAENKRFTEVVANNGVSEVAALNQTVFSLDLENLNVGESEATILRRRWFSGDLLRLQLKSGFVERITSDHLLLDGNTLGWREASTYKRGDLLVAPLKLPPPRQDKKKIYLWDILPDDCTVSLTPEDKITLRALLESRYGTLKLASNALGVARLPKYYRNRLQPKLRELKVITKALGVEEAWRREVHVYSKSPILTSAITPELAYICGFIFGDGHVKSSEKRSAIVLTQSPVHAAYMEQFENCWNSSFAPLHFRKAQATSGQIRGRAVASERVDWSVSRRVLGFIYQFITESKLSKLVSLPHDILKGFLAGVTDSDGCSTSKHSVKGNKSFETWNVVYEASRDTETNLNLLLALRRFDCLGSFRGIRKGVGIIVISSRRDCQVLHEALSEYSVKMRRVPSQRRRNIRGLSEKLPKKPVADVFRRAFEAVGRNQLIASKIWSTVYEYSNERRQPSTGQVQKVMARTPSMTQRDREALTTLMTRDYFLDEITEIRREPYEGYVYDLMMRDENHNFVADGVFSHNCIDEFDKMRPEDRSALHEQMEQQTCTIAKGGIYATLNARTAILAAINPVLGKYDAYQNLTDNINLPIPLLTRFDLIFVIRDTPTPAQDELLASHILEVHRKRSFTTAPPVQFDLLKKYITFVKKMTPTLTREAEERLKEYYLSLRRSTTEGQIGATPRTLESLIRTATARARLLLRDQVTEEDALAAISLMKRMVEDVLTDAATQTKGDFGVLFGKPVGEKNKLSAAMQVFKQLEGEGAQRRPVEGRLFREELIKTAKFTDEDADKLITNMLKEGIIYESKTGFFRRVGS